MHSPPPMTPVASLVILLGLGTLLALLATRFGVGALSAYLVTGIVVGPAALGWVNPQLMGPLAEIGAALLLFALGLELDVGEMAKRASRLGLATGLQVGLTILVCWLGALAIGSPGPLGVALGACLAMSSTLLVLRVLDERRLRNRDEGRLALGLCLLQDVAIGPLLVLLSFLLPVGEHKPWLLPVGVVGLLLGTLLLRRTWASRLVIRISATKVPELEVAFALVVALGAAWFSESCGLGAAAGAFCAGLAFGRGEHQKSILLNLTPLTGLASILFFIAIGITFKIQFVLEHPLLVFGGFLSAVCLKAVIAGFAFRIAGLPIRAAIGTGILSANIGEFALVLALAALAPSPDPQVRQLYDLVVSVTVLSFLAMPVLVLAARPFLPQPRSSAVQQTGRTIIVAGLGPVGNQVVTTLREQGWPLFLVDRNQTLLKPWEDVAGVTIHQGRIEDMDDWLPILGHRPSAVVLTYPIADASAAVATRLKAIDPNLPIIARSPYLSQIAILEQAGVRYIICDERETANALLPLVKEALRDRHGTDKVAVATIHRHDPHATIRLSANSSDPTATLHLPSAVSTPNAATGTIGGALERRLPLSVPPPAQDPPPPPGSP